MPAAGKSNQDASPPGSASDPVELLDRPVLRPDFRVAYGSHPSQFGDLWLPASASRAAAPLVVFFHGGWWKSQYDLGYAGYLCQALKDAGVASWSVEYRRLGSTGGGWPHTFRDAAAGLDHAAALARAYPLDLHRVITVGHSAGALLAFWNAGRPNLDPGSALFTQPPQVALRGAIALAGVVDLRLTCDLSGYFTYAHDKREVYALMGGSPREQPGRYEQGNPGDLLPFPVPQVLIQGSEDDQIPYDLPARWAERARRAGNIAAIHRIQGARHFDVVDPASNAWPDVREAVLHMLG